MSSYLRALFITLIAACGFDPHGLQPDGSTPPVIDSSVDTATVVDAMPDASNAFRIIYFRMAKEVVNGVPMHNGRAGLHGTAEWSAEQADQCLGPDVANPDIPEWVGPLTEGTTGSRMVSQPLGLANVLGITCKSSPLPDLTASTEPFCGMHLEVGTETLSLSGVHSTFIEWACPGGSTHATGIADPPTVNTGLGNGGRYEAQQRFDFFAPNQTSKQGVICKNDQGTPDEADDTVVCSAWVNMTVVP